MIQTVESEEPPLRLILEADAYGLWKKKRDTMDAELATWRKVGEDNAFADAQVTAIGG